MSESTRTAVPTDEEIVQEFMRDLADCMTFLRTERKNALNEWDTRSWGDRGKDVILNALKSRQPTSASQ